MNKIAYVVLTIDTRDLHVTYVGCYSEETPMMSSYHFVSAVLFHTEGPDFATAMRNASAAYRTNYPSLARHFPLPHR